MCLPGNRSVDFSDLESGACLFPVVTERIDNASDAPAVGLIGDRMDGFCAGANRTVERGIGIPNHHHHSHRAAAQAFRAEIEVLGRLIRNPEFGCAHGKLRDHTAAFAINPENYAGSEGRLVELHGLRSATNG